MAQEDNDGAAHLLALKQSAGPGSAAAAAPARAGSPAPPNPETGADPWVGRFPQVDKRRSPRYRCVGSAEMRVPDTDVRTWATFTDISMHGCYVEAATTYPVGTAVHLKLDANGIQVRTKSTVRVTYAGLGMGFAFTEISEEDSKHLRELVRVVWRPSIVRPGMAVPVAAGARDSVPVITDPAAALQALIEFFDNRHMLMREEFLRILRKSQG